MVPCQQKLAATANHRLPLPECIQPYISTNLAWNNIN